MSTHFKITLASIVILAGPLFGLYSCAKRKIENTFPRLDPSFARPAHSYKKPGDVAAVHVDNARHTVTLETSQGTTTEYSGRSVTLHVGPDGKVRVDRKLFGLEHAPFLGVGYGDGSPRFNVGLSLAYAYKFDVNVQAAIALQNVPRTLDLPLSLSYNFYSNTSVYIGTSPLTLLLGGPPTTYHVGVFVRL